MGHSLAGWAAIVTAAREPRLRAVAVYGAAASLGASLRLRPEVIAEEFTRFLAATPEEFARQVAVVAERIDALAAAAAIRPRPLLVVHGTEDRWVPWRRPGTAGPGRADVPLRRGGGGQPRLSWHRAELADLITDWLTRVAG